MPPAASTSGVMLTRRHGQLNPARRRVKSSTSAALPVGIRRRGMPIHPITIGNRGSRHGTRGTENRETLAISGESPIAGTTTAETLLRAR